MSPRKDRTAVVLDTNVLVAYYLSKKKDSANSKVFLLWRTRRRLQLIVSAAVIEEYLEVLQRLGVPQMRINRLEERIRSRQTVAHINLGARPTESRDPDDNLILATAVAGKAEYVVTNDHDLLDIPDSAMKKFRFAIVTPGQLLDRLEEKAIV
ncbi:MAG TPA: putative toxin-antitoxin system toxin component, PIN family [Pyrinomonadaceae bacterium]|nr:putative toxin-antitoxin system toxin component, PIN family [Pyrinomonadaceae bacterium]